MEVDGVAREVALGPAPVTILDEETGKGGQKVVAAPVFEQLEVPFLEQRQERSQSGGADLLASPACAGRFKRWVGHSLSSNGVG